MLTRFGLVGSFALLICSCSDGVKPLCNRCRDNETQIEIIARGAYVASLVHTGPACEAAWISSDTDADAGYRSSGFVSGAHSYTIQGLTDGSCIVTVQLGDATSLSGNFKVYHGTECCSGMFIDGTPWVLAATDAGATD